MPSIAHPWEENWLVKHDIGHGGQGTTHVVAKRQDASIVGALKCLKNNSHAGARARMRREVAALQTLSHQLPVPKVLEDNTSQYENLSVELFVVMELIPGPTLAEYVVANGPLDIDCSSSIIRAIANAIERAHSIDILHRDLKPDNCRDRGPW